MADSIRRGAWGSVGGGADSQRPSPADGLPRPSRSVMPGDVVPHSDNGSPMRGATMLATLRALGVVPSFSRPSVSDDNPFSESLSRTLKYRPEYPQRAFENLPVARAWVERCVCWYNTEHGHSALKFLTPEQRHNAQDVAILAHRHEPLSARARATPAMLVRPDTKLGPSSSDATHLPS